MKKPLPTGVIAAVVAVALLVAGYFVAKPAMSTPGPDASQVHVSAEEIARQRANPPKDERPLPGTEPGGGRPMAGGHGP